MKEKKILIGGNWKNLIDKEIFRRIMCNKSYGEIVSSQDIQNHVEIFIAVPNLLIKDAAKMLGFKLASQDISAFEGTITGETMAEQLLEDVEYSIIGHSERRNRLGETNKIIGLKVHQALKNGIRPVLCIGESIKERKNKKYIAFLKKQLLESLPKRIMSNILKLDKEKSKDLLRKEKDLNKQICDQTEKVLGKKNMSEQTNLILSDPGAMDNAISELISESKQFEKKDLKEKNTPYYAIGPRMSYSEKYNLFNEMLSTHFSEETKSEIPMYLELDIAYEPCWAIGNEPATISEIEEVAINIRIWMSEWNINGRVLYGGAVSDLNAKEILKCEGIEGVLVGGASHDIRFFEIVKIASEVAKNKFCP